MTPSEFANMPKWNGEDGYYEIWFAVIFEPDAPRSYWLRYTLFTPKPGVAAERCATVWAACFDAEAVEPSFAFKNVFPLSQLDRGLPDQLGVRIGPCRLGHGALSGNGGSDWHHLVWDLRFQPREQPAERDAGLLGYLPLPFTVSRTNAEVVFHGTIMADGKQRELRNAPGLQYHIWGTRRIEELRWLYCKRFDDAPNTVLEVTSARATRQLPGGFAAPWLTPLYWRSDRELALTSPPHVLSNRFEVAAPGLVTCRAQTLTEALHVRAWWDPGTAVGYVYRDPDGHDLYVAQSDIAHCEVEASHRATPFARWIRGQRFVSRHGAALELHGPEPLEGVAYIPWEAEHLEGVRPGGQSDAALPPRAQVIAGASSDEGGSTRSPSDRVGK